MSDILRTAIGGVSRQFGEADLPLAVTRGDDRRPRIGPAGEAAGRPVALWLGVADGRLFARPDSGDRDIRHNGAPVGQPVWLDGGDRLELGDGTLRVSVEDGVFVLSEPAAEIPVAPPAAAPGASSLPPSVSPPPPRPRPARRKPPVSAAGRRLRLAVAGALSVLVVCVAFVLAATPVRIATDPAADSLSFSGFPPAVKLLGRYLALPGTYRVRAEKTGYRPLDAPVTVAFGAAQDLTLKMRELPGYLRLRAETPAEIEVAVDGRPLGRTPLTDVELEAGPRRIVATAPRHRDRVLDVAIQGRGVRQTLDLALDPAWGTLVVETVPPGADVRVADEKIGETPLQAEPLEGRYRLDISRAGFKPVQREVFVIAGQTVRLPPIELEKADAIVALTSEPPGATVTVDGEFRGRTPVSVEVGADREHAIRFARAGYRSATRTLTAGPGETRALDVALEPELGTVFITVRPADAELKIDGRPAGRAAQRLRLPTVPHELEIARAGYETQRITVTPKPDIPGRLNLTLRTADEAARERDAREVLRTAAGQTLVRVRLSRPVTFDVGGSRRDAGRRSNEANYRVELTRSFLISAREVTNAEFRAFRSAHDSGRVRGLSLDGPDQPVVAVSWQDAARYLNWLSARDGLPPAYVEQGGEMAAAQPMTTGYRLPTEAEWVFAARYEAGRRAAAQPLRYPWGEAMPPAGKAGNFADASALAELPGALRGYRDGYTVTAPVGQFAPNAAGLYDLGGNASEWCHDYYDIRAGAATDVLRDPVGPASGRFRVVRGSSWRHGSVSELRFAWRDFAEKPRDDIGFRIARYAD